MMTEHAVTRAYNKPSKNFTILNPWQEQNDCEVGNNPRPHRPHATLLKLPTTKSLGTVPRQVTARGNEPRLLRVTPIPKRQNHTDLPSHPSNPNNGNFSATTKARRSIQTRNCEYSA